MTMARLTRRGFLGLAGALPVTARLLGGASLLSGCSSIGRSRQAVFDAAARLSTVAGARGLGRAYLQSRDPVPAMEALLSDILDGLAGHPTEGFLHTLVAGPSTRRWLAEEARRGHFESVDGWVLPRLEAQLYGLAYLLYRRDA